MPASQPDEGKGWDGTIAEHGEAEMKNSASTVGQGSGESGVSGEDSCSFLLREDGTMKGDQGLAKDIAAQGTAKAQRPSSQTGQQLTWGFFFFF